MEMIIKTAAVGIIGTMLAVTVKEYKKEFSLLIGIATGIVIVYMLIDSLTQIRNLFGAMITEASINSEYVEIMVKVIIIAYVCEFAVQFCADAGERAIGTKIELAGRILILTASLPIIENLFNLIVNLSL
ncbi:MAG: stage III sporulation protein AD [Clostridiales bacterium]|nr:stage III sporulation protein AD [Clostridiales bacterium]